MFEIALERRTPSTVATVTARGTMDARSGDHLASLLLLVAGSERVIIDLAEVSVVDLAGVQAVVGAIGDFRELGGEVELIATPMLVRVFRERGVLFAS